VWPARRAAQAVEITVGPWLSLVERLVRDEEAAGSNPAGPTIFFTGNFSLTLTSLKYSRDENLERPPKDLDR
jgi:hypothetical protein